MNILGISTSSDICSVSLFKNTNCIQELNITNSKTHSENLMPLIDELLKNHQLSVEDINLLACDNGPGSFTGLRIGIATIKALAESNSIPVICCSSLECLAYNIVNPEGNICSLIDAKNNQVYAGIFDKNYNLLTNYLADDINNVLTIIKKYQPTYFVGNASSIHIDILPTGFFSSNNELHSKNVCLCAFHKFNNGFVQSADTIVPMYLRKSQAERMKLLNGKHSNI